MSEFGEDRNGLISEVEAFLVSNEADRLVFEDIAHQLEDSMKADWQNDQEALRERCTSFLAQFCVKNPGFDVTKYTNWLERKCAGATLFYSDCLPYPGATWIDNYILSFQDLVAEADDEEEIAAKKLSEAAMIGDDFGKHGGGLLAMLDVIVPAEPFVRSMRPDQLQQACIRLNGRGPEQERQYAGFMICFEPVIVTELAEHYVVASMVKEQREALSRNVFYYAGVMARNMISPIPEPEFLTLQGQRRMDRNDHIEKKYFVDQALTILATTGKRGEDAKHVLSELANNAYWQIGQKVRESDDD